MPVAWVSAGAAILNATKSSSSSGGSSAGNPGAAAAADPFASQRSQYQPQLQQLVANPSSVTSTPGYQFQMQQGLEATQASSAAQGLGVSGSNSAALTSYAEGLASNTYQQQFNNLALLSGATSGNTGAASQAVTTGNNNINSAISNVAGAAGKGLSSWMNGNNSSTSGGTSSAVVDPSSYTSSSTSTGGFSAQPLFGGGGGAGGTPNFSY